MGVVKETRRVLKPSGSAVFILQPNSKCIGSMRLWLWEFMIWSAKEWNLIQDVYWWNYVMPVLGGANKHGLLRESVKTMVWLGNPQCYKNQDGVLWATSQSTKARLLSDRASGISGKSKRSPSGIQVDLVRRHAAIEKRGGVTPFNMLPIQPDGNRKQGGHIHGAATPLELAKWWVRYICPPGGVVADWFMGSGTMGIAAVEHGCSFIGFEKMPAYFEIAQRRITEARPQLALPMETA